MEGAMFEQVIESFRKASESASQAQQELYRQWLQQLPTTPLNLADVSAGQRLAFQKRMAEVVKEALSRHRDALHAMYGSGIQLIEQTFRFADARRPDDLRRLVDELWKKLSNTFREQSEAQLHALQNMMDSWLQSSHKAQS
ncbi:MAG TPA: hypothetical protein VG963_22225 [Polyangiaceae bacterium]|nr:hypothetical protein [Polyangiaceae bacterium]